jgi:hypothetical protein
MKLLAFVTITVCAYASALAQDISNSYVCCLAAVPSEREAIATVDRYRAQAVTAGYLWIPDYAGLSGKPFFLVYAGPYADIPTAKDKLAELKDRFDNRSFYVKNVGQKLVESASSGASARAVESASVPAQQAPAIVTQPVISPASAQKTKAIEQPARDFKKTLKLNIGKDNVSGSKKP